MSNSTKNSFLLPGLAIAALGAAAGVFVANNTKLSDDSATSPFSSKAGQRVGLDDDSAALKALQADLERTLLLPEDYRSVPDSTLSDVHGQPITTAALLDGKWTLMFFGYTFCPDVCPVTLQVMNEVVSKMEANGDEPMQVVFVTVDPVRDTAERMKDYVSYFNSDFIGITGELDAIQKLTRSLGVIASFTASKDNPENYIVDHTASMLLVSPDRRIRAKFAGPHEADTIIDDYLTLMAALN
ncbi:MAG: SCO family protein [Granulosicoccus sp.]